MMEPIVRWIQASLQWVDDSLRVAVAAHPTLMLILFLLVGLAVGVWLSYIVQKNEAAAWKDMKGKPRRRRIRVNRFGEPLEPDWWENKPWWRWK